MFAKNKTEMPSAEAAPQGRHTPIAVPQSHHVNGNQMEGPYPANMEIAVFGMGCFWGVERLFWQQAGVFTTAAGYLGGSTVHPSYEEVCLGKTGHNEVVQVVFDPAQVRFEKLLSLFWETHDPTQGMRQGNDLGTQYRSGIYASTDEQRRSAMTSRDLFQQALSAKGFGPITTEIVSAGKFYFAEAYHQQYLAKNPGGYCNLQGTGIRCSGVPA